MREEEELEDIAGDLPSLLEGAGVTVEADFIFIGFAFVGLPESLMGDSDDEERGVIGEEEVESVSNG